MKKIYNIFVFAACFLAVSCLQDLNTLPLNDYDKTSEAAYVDGDSYLKGLAYINAYYNFVSQNDPGASDLPSFSDAGQSELMRQWTVLNDLPTNSMDISWGDSYVESIETHTWTNAANTAITAVYTRALKGVVLANEFLLQTTDQKLAARGHTDLKGQIEQYRAEARFHRAMFNYILLDLFGNPPYATEENIGGDLPKQFDQDFAKGRAGFFNALEAELLDLVSDASALPARGATPYPRPTKDAAKALLARLYLNAEVYTGTARWADAKKYASEIIANGYSLHPKYAELFLQDNGEKCANDEFIFAIEYDTSCARSWGGTTTLSSGAFNDNMNIAISTYLGTETPYVSAETWNGYRIDPQFIADNAEGVEYDPSQTLGYDPAAGDQRLRLFIEQDPASYSRSGETAGWRLWKWAKMDSNNNVISRGGDDNPDWKFSSADIAIFRLPEMYYIVAESDARLNGGTTTDATAVGYINALRKRAGLSGNATSYTVQQILKDKAVEMLWEGQRRQDEIRLGIFDANKAHYVYPLLETDISVNPNIKQNPGY